MDRSLLNLIGDYVQLLWKTHSFRATKDDFLSMDFRHAIIGLALIGLAGMGRWWDDPTVSNVAQRMGLGSIVYSLFLAGALWLSALIWGLKELTYLRFLGLMGLVAPLAFLYAIPVERIVGNANALSLNLAFLGIVAAYRVTLLYRFFRVAGSLSKVRAFVVTALPICGIGFSLFVSGFGDSITRAMGGLRDETPSTNETVSDITTFVGFFISLLTPIVLISFFVIAARLKKERKQAPQ